MNRIDMGKKVTLYRTEPEGKFLGRLSGMLVYVEGDEFDDQLVVTAYRDEPVGSRKKTRQPIAELMLFREHFANAYHVDLMRVDNRFQGHGIGPKLYRYVLRKLRIVIQAGSMQSGGGRKIWAKLAEMPGVFVFASHRRGRQLFDVEVDENEELTSDQVKLYDGQRSVYTFAVAA